MSNDEFFKSLSDAEWDEAEGLEIMGQALCTDLTEETDLRFVRAAMEKKRAKPTALTIELVNAGLVAIGKRPLRIKRERKFKLSGAGV